jgi:hypothetical protein
MPQPQLLDELLSKLGAMPPTERAELDRAYAKEAPKWLPNVGPQTLAYLCPADLLFYGGQGGGGKSDLGLGLAFTQHRRSLLMRRKYVDLNALVERALEINGTRDGFNGQPPPKLRTADDRLLHFGANQHLGDEQSWQGQPYDLKFFDEVVQFLEAQVRFHLGWIRSTDVHQRCRAVLGSNPPLDANGQWVVGMFRPWLDLTHPNPAKHGELRWFITDPDGKDMEVAGPEPVEIDGKALIPQSRTFIPAKLSDNPFLINTNYQAQLDALPEPLRSAVRDGNFMASRKDADNQVIPTAWVIAAQARWRPEGWKDYTQTAIGYDPAGGGKDEATIARRHGGWYDKIIAVQGDKTMDGAAMAAKVLEVRRDNAPVVVDVGGGYAGASIERFKDNSVVHIRFNGAGSSTARTKQSSLPFANKRAEAWWRFREALDPMQEGGSAVELPDDPQLRADLTTPTWELRSGKILVESKEDIRERLGRSPDRADAVVMALSEGDAARRKELTAMRLGHQTPQVVMGRALTRRK